MIYKISVLIKLQKKTFKVNNNKQNYSKRVNKHLKVSIKIFKSKMNYNFKRIVLVYWEITVKNKNANNCLYKKYKNNNSNLIRSKKNSNKYDSNLLEKYCTLFLLIIILEKGAIMLYNN